MIDITKEHVFSLAAGCELLPPRRSGKKADISCLYRWTTIGCRGEVLDSIQIGATRCTSAEALADFFARLSRKRATRQTQSASSRRAKTAGAKLDALGIQADRTRVIKMARKTI